MHARKTGALITASVLAGATMVGADAASRVAVYRHTGESSAWRFRSSTTCSTWRGRRAELGKTAGKDAAAGKPTYPALFGLDASKQLAREAVDRARQALAVAGIDGRLPEIADWVVQRTS